MPLQNRVDPFGQLHANSARGLFMGNRGGRFHDPATQTLKRSRWTSNAWIICVCDFNNRQRNVWGTKKDGKASYTELFFLDEVTALAAGHRPCFECRRASANAYAGMFGSAIGARRPKVDEMDRVLHGERLAARAQPPSLSGNALAALPDGAMVTVGEQAFAIKGGHALLWSFDGYGASIPISRLASGTTLLTPRASVNVLLRGYQPVWHPSAQASIDWSHTGTSGTS